MNASGVWRGCLNGKVGYLKSMQIEVIQDSEVKGAKKPERNTRKACPTTVDELLSRIGLKEYTSVFVLNGWGALFGVNNYETKIALICGTFSYSYEDLELFKELEPTDLNYLGIFNVEHRAKLLAAVQLLHVIDSNGSDEVAGSSSENDENRLNIIQKKNSVSPFGRRHFPRDSGCYEGSLLPTVSSIQATVETNCFEDSIASECPSDVFKRLESSRLSAKEPQDFMSKRGLMKKGLLGGAINSDEICSRGEGGALSEKSSDSGVSSSSLSGPIRNNL